LRKCRITGGEKDPEIREIFEKSGAPISVFQVKSMERKKRRDRKEFRGEVSFLGGGCVQHAIAAPQPSPIKPFRGGLPCRQTSGREG